MNKNKKVKLFLDSGAFSAFTKGVEIDIDEYIKFIKQYKNDLEVYANLDVIGDPKKTYENQLYMEKKGLSPLPVFHHGGDTKYLKRYVENYDYLALGGLVGGQVKILTPWLDDVFTNHICDDNGMPKVMVHGFGITSLKLLLRYPWYSVDSTSWVMASRMGTVYIPKYKNDELCYLEDCLKVAVSNQSPSMKDEGQHIETISPMIKAGVMRYLKEKGYQLGRSEFKIVKAERKLKEGERWAGKANADGTRKVETVIEVGLCNDYKLRDELNIIYYMDLEKALPKWPWAFKLRKKAVFEF